MAVIYYDSLEDGAPQMTSSGTSGNYTMKINEILEATLVNGFNGKPGLGWTKEFVSELEGSDRTVYKNKSAYDDDLFLLVQSDAAYASQIKLQIAESCASPEQYSGYSSVAAIRQQTAGNQRWHVIGDERTMILIFYSETSANQGRSSSHNPVAVYVGDFDTQGSPYSKGWGIVCPSLQSGNLDGVHVGDSVGSLGFDKNTKPSTAVSRPVTQMPGIPWSLDTIPCYFDAFFARVTESFTGTNLALTHADFEPNVQLKSPWHIILDKKYIYRMRGIFCLYPFLCHINSGYNRNWAIKTTVHGQGYLPLDFKSTSSYWVPMLTYIQTTGDW